MKDRVPASVAVLLVENQQILLGRRQTENAFEGWQCPGGFLLRGESVVAAAQRCSLQKAGIAIDEIEDGPFVNNLFPVESPLPHSVTLYTIARKHRLVNLQQFQHPQFTWQWFHLDNLPESLFLPLDTLCRQTSLMRLLAE